MYASGVQVQPSEMKVDRCLISITVPKATSPILQTLNLAVNSLCSPVISLKDNRVDDAPQVLFNRSGNFFDGLKATSLRPA